MDPSPTRPQHFQSRTEWEESTLALDDDQLEYPTEKVGDGMAPDHDANTLLDTTTAKLELPRSNPALDAVLIPALSDWSRSDDDVEHDPERKSVYPSLVGLGAEERILSFESAMSYQRRVINVRNHPFDDSSLPGVQLRYLQHVKDVYAAMIDVSVAQNTVHCRALRHMSSRGRNRKPHYPAVKLVAKAHAIVSVVIDGAINGFRKTKNQGQARQAREDDLYASASDRLETMCTALKENKNVVAEVLEEDEQTIINFAYAPKALMSVRSIALRDSESKVATKAAPSQQVATPSPGPSTPGDTPGGSELSSTGLIQVYPPFDDLPADEQLADLQAAEPHLNKAEERDDPLESDPHLPLLKQNASPLFRKLYEAITDVTQIQNPPASKEYKWFVQGAARRRKAAFFPVQDLQELCWRILVALLDATAHGFPTAVRRACTNDGPLSLPPAATSAQRFASVLEVLRRDKAICARLLKRELTVGALLCQPHCLAGDVRSGRDRHRRKPAVDESETAKRRRDGTASPATAKFPRLATRAVRTAEPALNGETASPRRGGSPPAPLQQQHATSAKQEDTHSDASQQRLCDSESNDDTTTLPPAAAVPAASAPRAPAEKVPATVPQHATAPVSAPDSGAAELDAEREAGGGAAGDGGAGEEAAAAAAWADDELLAEVFVDGEEVARVMEEMRRFIY